MNILVTGGAGYIGSHFVNYLSNRKVNIYIIDNLSRGNINSVQVSGNIFNVDLRDKTALDNFFKDKSIDFIVHFAAFAYVGESCTNPTLYYENNLLGSYNLITTAYENGIKNFIFSSTCSVYGDTSNIPINETEQVNPINPYANTKFMIEKILDDFRIAYGINYISLRYFNAAGADDTGFIGESHNPETHLIPLIFDVVDGKKDFIEIYGNDYPTKDGTCVRDYIHVNDLANAHWLAIKYLINNKKSDIFNLGTEKGYSVFEIVYKIEEITGKKVNKKIVQRRNGDPAVLIADSRKAQDLLKWKPNYSLDDIIKTAWNWYQNKRY